MSSLTALLQGTWNIAKRSGYTDASNVNSQVFRNLSLELRRSTLEQPVHTLKMDEDYHFLYGSVPNTLQAKICVAWMKRYFETAGDHNPTKNEIHLDVTTKKAIYQLYAQEMNNYNEEYPVYSYGKFVFIWNEVFSHVSIREYKDVTGKCDFCAKLTILRQDTNNWCEHCRDDNNRREAGERKTMSDDRPVV